MDKPGYKTTEFWLAGAGIFAAVLVSAIPLIIGIMPPNSAWVPLLGAILAAAKYMHDRSKLKIETKKTEAVVAAASREATPPNP